MTKLPENSAVMPDVIIIGGGIHGLSTAIHLAERGVKCVLLEKDWLGAHASGANAGGVRTLGRTVAELPLSLASQEIWRGLSDFLHADGVFQLCGHVRVAENEEELAQARQRVEMLTGLGYNHEILLNASTLREIVPAIAPHCLGGIYAPGDGQAYPFRVMTALGTRARALGIDIRLGARAVSLKRVSCDWAVETTTGTFVAPVVVNCAGAWAGLIAAELDDFLPVEAEAPMGMITERMPFFVKPVVSPAGRRLSFKQFDNGTVLIGGGLRGRPMRDDNSTALDLSRFSERARTALSLFPLMRSVKIVRFWAALESKSLDGIPIVGPSPAAPNVYHACGFCGHGFQLGPAVGRVLSELIVDGRTTIDISPLAPARFSETSRAAVR